MNLSRVVLIFREDDMPPIGSIGTIVGQFEGDFEVEFDDYPCEAGPGTDWLCDPKWLVYLNGPTAQALRSAMRDGILAPPSRNKRIPT